MKQTPERLSVRVFPIAVQVKFTLQHAMKAQREEYDAIFSFMAAIGGGGW
jgi:hypothetical protein